MKTPWEARVGVLIDPRFHPLFAYSFKPYDSGMYGGQPRIDWHACDQLGLYWMIEVKSLPPGRKSINLDTEITAGQRDGLTAISNTSRGMAFLAVGQGRTLYLFPWSMIRNRPRTPAFRLLPLADAVLQLDWSPKTWREFDLWETLYKAGHLYVVPPLPGSTPTAPTTYELESPTTLPTPSLSTSKRADCIRMRRQRLLSGQ